MKLNFKSFCKISDYLELHDEELYNLFKGTCLIPELMSMKGKDGITLLSPQGAFRKKIADLATSDDVAEFRKASEILRACILRDVYKSAADWNAKRANIPNSQYPSQHLEIESATGKEVVTKSGAKLKPDEKFRDGTESGKLAVWIIASGEIVPTTDKPAKKRIPVKGKGVSGGRVNIESIQSSTRFSIITTVENAFLADMIQGNMGRESGRFPIRGGSRVKPLASRRRNAFLEAFLSFAHYAHAEAGEEGRRVLYEWILPHMSFNNSDLYYVLQPFSEPSSQFVPESMIEGWVEFAATHDVNFQETVGVLCNALSNPPAQYRQCKLYSDRPGIENAIDRIRKNDVEQCVPRACYETASARYSKLETANSINDLQGIYPESTAKYYAAHPGLKLAEDELRYVSHILFRDIQKGSKNAAECNAVFNRFRSVLTSETQEEYGVSALLCSQIERNMIPNAERVEECRSFIKSTYYLFVPLTIEEMSHLQIKSQLSKPKRASLMVWNLHSAAANNIPADAPSGGYGGGSCGMVGAAEAVQVLNSIGANSSPAVKEAIRMAANRAGI
jgi:hypothetical protein